MEGLTIAKAAEETGFSPSALRFYEGQGLITPARTTAGYRTYDPASIETLRFIARAKRLGLSLHDISDLVTLLDEERCAPVQERLRTLLQDKITDAQDQTATLIAFTAQLQQAAARLGQHTPDGPCDDTCGCTTDSTGNAAVLLGAKPQPVAEPPIACTLTPGAMRTRLEDWQTALVPVTRREAIERGVRVHLPRQHPIASLAELIEAEQSCCAFLSFALHVGTDGIILDVTGPEDAELIVEALEVVPEVVGVEVAVPRLRPASW